MGTGADPLCAGSPCNWNTDHRTCFDPQGKCQHVPCQPPTGWIDKPNKHNLFCRGATCSRTADRTNCCNALPACRDQTCAAGWKDTANKHAKYYPTTSQASCQEACCDKVAPCSSLTCVAATGWKDKGNKNTLWCDTATCNAGRDSPTCCDKLDACLSHTCPTG